MIKMRALAVKLMKRALEMDDVGDKEDASVEAALLPTRKKIKFNIEDQVQHY